ncbi:MAG: PAS domain-containing protein [Sneathiella sp.]|nr:PAS domain-containing protein [Sneathiella sp.]
MELGIIDEQERSDNFRKVVRLEVTSKDDFKTDTVRSLYEWWRSFQPSLPTRADFDIARHWRLAPFLYVIEVLGPGKYLHRLNGEKVVEIVGVSMRGHEISPGNPLPENRLFAEYLNTLVDSRQCRRCSGTADVFGKKYHEFETVDCPLQGKNGEIAFIIGAISLTS